LTAEQVTALVSFTDAPLKVLDLRTLDGRTT
jgi:hypothetical protein